MIECQYETYPTPSQADSGEAAEGMERFFWSGAIIQRSLAIPAAAAE